jgi:hypothetical protein
MRAASLLDVLKGKLADVCDKPEVAVVMRSPRWSTHWRLCNVAGVHAYRTPRGWCTDLAFRDLPAGVPAVIGNSLPFATREEALDNALLKLFICAETEKAWLADFDARMRWFAFDGIMVPVDPDYLPGRAVELAREGYTRDHVLGRLAYLRHVVSGDEPVTEESFAAADGETRQRVAIVSEIAMSLGLNEFTPADGPWAEYMPTVPGPMQ